LSLLILSLSAQSLYASFDVDVTCLIEHPASQLARTNWTWSGETEQELALEGEPLELKIDLTCTQEALAMASLADLRSVIARLPGSALRDLLDAHMAALQDEHALIEGMVSPPGIQAIEDALENVEHHLDEIYELLEDHPDVAGRFVRGTAMARAKGLERIIDGLEYIAARFRMYAHAEVSDDASRLIRRATLAALAGNSWVAASMLRDLRRVTEEGSGEGIEKPEADRILGKIDTLLKTWGEDTSGFALDLAGASDALSLPVDWAFRFDRSNGALPADGRLAFGVGIASEIDADGLAISLEAGFDRTAYDAQVRRESNVITKQFAIALDWAWPDWELECSWSVDHSSHPDKTDEEFAAEDVARAGAGLKHLVAAVKALGLAAGIEADLLDPLEMALSALADGQLDDAVDELEDFIEEVWEHLWKGTLVRSAADRLVLEAETILPRRTSLRSCVPIDLATTVGTWDVKPGIEWESIGYRSCSRLDRRDRSWTLALDGPWGENDVDLDVEFMIVEYPNDAAKTYQRQELRAGLSHEHECLDVDGSVKSQETIYPQAPAKAKVIGENDISVEFEHEHGSVTIERDWKRTTYPADPSKDVVTVIRIAMDASWSLPAGELAWDWELQTTGLASSGEEKCVEGWELEWQGEPPNMAELTYAAAWKRNWTWDDPSKDSTQVRLEVELDW